MDLGAGSILFGTLTTEEPWIKVQVSLYDIGSGAEIASKETKLYKNVALRAFLERGELPPDCLVCKHPHFTPHETQRAGSFSEACPSINHILLCFLRYSIPFVDKTFPARRSSNIVA